MNTSNPSITLVKGAAGAFSDLLMSGRDEASELVRDQIF